MKMRIVTILLVFFMIIVNGLTINLNDVVADETKPIVKIGDTYYYSDIVADAPTNTVPILPAGASEDDPKGYFKTAGGDGRVWTDKSVAVASDNKSFDITLSTIGQSYTSTTSVISQARADVLLLLDVTGSMDDNDIQGTGDTRVYRYEAMVNAANQAIKIIMEANPDNRVEVATFGNTNASNWGRDRVLLPLDSYELTNNYISFTRTGGFSISIANGLKKKDGTSIGNKSISKTSVGTQTQHSIYESINHMINEVSGTASVKTIPYVLLLTDGNANRWDTSNLINPTNTDNSGGDKTGAAVTILTAAYWKDQLSNKYYEYNGLSNPDPSVATRFFSIALSNDVNNEFNALISPKLLLSEYDDGNGHKWTSTDQNRNVKENISVTLKQANDVIEMINYYAKGDLSSYSTTAGDKYIYTTDTYYYKTSTVAGLNQAFKDLANNVKEETKPIVIPVEETTSTTTLGGVEMLDYIGDGMKVKLTDTFIAKAGGTSFVMNKVSPSPEGVVARYAYNYNGKTMTVDITKDTTGNQILTWNVPAGVLPLFKFDQDTNTYSDANPITITYNVQIDETKPITDGSTFYSNLFTSGSDKGTAIGRYEPKNDNPHFYNTTPERADGKYPVNDRFNGKTVNVSKSGGNKTGTATNAGVADFTSTSGDGNHLVQNYLGNNGKIVLTKVPVTSVPVEKIWVDNNNSDTTRPASVTVNLYVGEEIAEDVLGNAVAALTLNSGNEWKGEFVDLPVKDSSGKDIVYTVKENAVDNYITDIQPDEAGGYVITNTLTTSVTVTKSWSDADNQDGKRPTTPIKVQLFKTKGSVTSEEGAAVPLNADLTYTFADLPKYEGGVKLTYTVKELNAEGKVEEGRVYNSDYSISYVVDEEAGTIAITNSHTPENITITGTKTWSDSDYVGKPGYARPDSIIIEIYDGTTKVDSITVNSSGEATDGSNVWNWASKSLPKYREGKVGEEIVYTVKEVLPNGYTSAVTGFAVENTPNDKEEKETPVTLTIEKRDSRTEDLLVGAKFTVTPDPKGDKESVEVVTDTYGKATVEFAKPGKYTLKETGAPEGYILDPTEYTVEVSRSEIVSVTYNTETTLWEWLYNLLFKESTPKDVIVGGVLTVYNDEAIDINVEKVWDDLDDEAKIRPESVTIALVAGGEILTEKTLVLSDENEWKGTFKGLNKYTKEGKEIEYSILEEDFGKYTVFYSGSASTTLIAKNYYRKPVPYNPPKTGVE